MTVEVLAQPEAELPEWERVLLTTESDIEPSYWEPQPLVEDAKDPRRHAYGRRKNGFQDHGTRGVEADQKFTRFYRAYEAKQHDALRPSKRQILEEEGIGLQDAVSLPEKLYADNWDENDTSGEHYPSFTYDGPYNPAKEKARKLEKRAKEVAETQERASELLAKLASGKIARGDALDQLLRPVYGEERQRLLELVDLHMYGYRDTDPVLEMQPVTGNRAKHAKMTLDTNPYAEDGVDYLDGFHVVDETRL